MGRVRAASLARIALALAFAFTGCRAVIGYRPITLPVDASVDARSRVDASVDASCPATTPTPFFTTSQPIASLFLSGSYVYAEVENLYTNDASFPGPFLGLLACRKTGCDRGPETLVDPTALPAADAAVWAGATSSDAGLFYALQRHDQDASSIVERLNADGGAAETLATGLTYPLLLAADSTTLYWTDDPASSTDGLVLTPWSVRARALGGSSAESTLLFTGFSEAGTYAIFLDSQNVYVVGGDRSGNVGLFVCPLLTRGGCKGAANELVSGISFTSDNFPTASFAADGTYVYEADSVTPGDITRIDLSTRVSTPLASAQSSPTSIVVSGDDLYWTTETGVVLRMAKDGMSPPVPVLCGSEVYEIAADSQHLYLVSAQGELGSAVASLPIP